MQARAWMRAAPAVVAFAVTAAAYLTVSLSQWFGRRTPSWDLGIFTQVVKHYGAFSPPMSEIKGPGFVILGDHFSPILALLGPVYDLFPSPLTLVIVEDVLFAFAAAVIAISAARHINRLSGFAIGIAFGLSFGLQSAVSSQFHEIAFAVPLLALSLASMLDRKWTACALSAAPLVFVKEDLGLTVAAIGLVLVWRSLANVGIALIVWGIGWFGLTVYVIIPAFSTGHKWAYSGTFDLGAYARQPWTAITHFVDDPQKLITLALLFGMTGLLCLRSPIMLIALPTIAWRFLSSNWLYWGHYWQYNAVLMPIAFVALIDAIRLLRASRRRVLRRYAPWAGAVSLAVSLALIPQLDLASLFQPSTYRPDAREAAASGALARIAPGTTVETDIGLMTYLVTPNTVYYVGNSGNPAPEYLVLDSIGGGWGSSPGDAAKMAEGRHPGTTYRTIYDRGGYEVAVKTG